MLQVYILALVYLFEPLKTYQQCIGIVFAYFAPNGVFSFGCAADICSTNKQIGIFYGINIPDLPINQDKNLIINNRYSHKIKSNPSTRIAFDFL